MHELQHARQWHLLLPRLWNGGEFNQRQFQRLAECTTGAPTGGVTVSGSVTYPGTVTGPLYVGFYNYSTGVFYGQYIQNPTSAQAFTCQVPIASTYYFVGVIDNNKNGVVDAGDINDVSSQGNPPLANITASPSARPDVVRRQ